MKFHKFTWHLIVFRITEKDSISKEQTCILFNSLCFPNNLWRLIKNALQRKEKKNKRKLFFHFVLFFFFLFLIVYSFNGSISKIRAKRMNRCAENTPFHKNYYLESDEIQSMFISKQRHFLFLFFFPFLIHGFGIFLRNYLVVVLDIGSRFHQPCMNAHLLSKPKRTEIISGSPPVPQPIWFHCHYFHRCIICVYNVFTMQKKDKYKKKTKNKIHKAIILKYDKNHFDKWDELMILYVTTGGYCVGRSKIDMTSFFACCISVPVTSFEYHINIFSIYIQQLLYLFIRLKLRLHIPTLLWITDFNVLTLPFILLTTCILTSHNSISKRTKTKITKDFPSWYSVLCLFRWWIPHFCDYLLEFKNYDVILQNTIMQENWCLKIKDIHECDLL